jgi:hypothetical protein
MPQPQFSFRKVNGIAELKVRDDRKLIGEISSLWPRCAPLLECSLPGEPSLEELKSIPEMLSLVLSIDSETGFLFCVQASKSGNFRKEATLVDAAGTVLAVATWELEYGFSFKKTG